VLADNRHDVNDKITTRSDRRIIIFGIFVFVVVVVVVVVVVAISPFA